jgi:hypothetical protein
MHVLLPHFHEFQTSLPSCSQSVKPPIQATKQPTSLSCCCLHQLTHRCTPPRTSSTCSPSLLKHTTSSKQQSALLSCVVTIATLPCKATSGSILQFPSQVGVKPSSLHRRVQLRPSNSTGTIPQLHVLMPSAATDSTDYRPQHGLLLLLPLAFPQGQQLTFPLRWLSTVGFPHATPPAAVDYGRWLHSSAWASCRCLDLVPVCTDSPTRPELHLTLPTHQRRGPTRNSCSDTMS